MQNKYGEKPSTKPYYDFSAKVYDNSCLPIAEIDDNLNIVYKNKCFTQFFGTRIGANVKHLLNRGESAEKVFEKIKEYE